MHKNTRPPKTETPEPVSVHKVDPTKFRIRGREVTRIEGFSDAVFAFAVTLMVVSLEVPKNYGELMHAMRGFFAFAACFATLFMIWNHQRQFFRNYGLQDSVTLLLNAVLLFVVLFYVYPLKFLFSLLVEQVMGNGQAFEEAFKGSAVSTGVETLMAIYSAGYLAVFLVFALLQRHAYSKRVELGLNEFECFDTRANFYAFLINISVAAISIMIALSGFRNAPFYSGMVYYLLGIAFPVFWSMAGRRRKVLVAKVSAAG